MADVFLGGEAVRAGVVTRHELARWYTPVFRGVYAPSGEQLSLRTARSRRGSRPVARV